MNTLTKNPTKALLMALDIADMRNQSVWLHITTMGTYFIDYIPDWWTNKEIEERNKSGEIVKPRNLDWVKPKPVNQ